ncbi:MAG: malectin domain-containing carbohydrate-binding protein [Acidimicrobiales bacterium]
MTAVSGLALAAAAPVGAAEPGFVAGSLTNAGVNKPTAMQFGPDDRLYVLELDGDIKALTITRNGAADYAVSASETIDLVKDLPNHDDDGSVNAGVDGRLATGLLTTGTATNPVLYVTSSDPRIGGGNDGTDLNLDTNSSTISRLTWDGAAWQHLELVRGLPRSEENHSANGLELDTVSNTLYVAQGGNTNLGAPSFNFALLPEYALSAAVLSVDLDAIGNSTYDIPTLAGTPLPFGGQSGDNQATLVAGGPVQVHAPGFRNAYDVVMTEAGELYTVDNGSNSGWGDVVANEGPGGVCTNTVQEPGFSEDDNMHNITVAGTYGGHANVLRGNPAGTPWAAAVPAANPIECDYQPVAGAVDGNMTTFPVSTNSLDEYTAGNFEGEMQGDIVAVGLNPPAVYRIELSPDGQSVTANTALFSNLNGRHLGLDVLDDNELFPGTVWVGEFTNNGIAVFEPNDYDGTPPTCTGADDPGLDEDNDGFDNADEIDNSTDPCSSADVPPDNDGDLESDLNDPDDDNDGLLDTVDPFAVDPANGAATNLPVTFEWENNSPPAGGLLELGFTGLMTNGTDYLDLFDPFAMTIGGAAGVITIDAAGPGTAEDLTNTAEYGFQVGVAPQVNPFEASLRVAAPFTGATPGPGQEMGFFLGTGTQDDYLELVVTDAGVELGVEVGGAFTPVATSATTIPGPDSIDLFFIVDPGAGTVQASYVEYSGGTPGPRVDVGGPQAVPAAWLTNPTAFGTTSSAAGGASFPVTFDRLDIRPLSVGGGDVGANVAITPTGGLNVSSHIAGSFSVENVSQSAQITSVSLDTTSALLPDVVFDQLGGAGDLPAGDVQIDVDPGVGYLGHTYASPNNGLDGVDGWHVATLNFDDFDPGEVLTFSADLDPTSIKGSARPGPGGSGKISGLELTGAVATVAFSDGTVLGNELYPPAGSSGGGTATIDVDRAAAPAIQLLGAPGDPASVTAAAQTIRVVGPVGADVRLVRAESVLNIDPPGYDIDGFETNSAISVQHYTATVGGQGFVDVAVTLTDAGPEGLNLFAATLLSTDGEPGNVSNQLTVELDPFGGGNVPPVITPIGSQSMLEGQTLDVTVTASDANGDAVALAAGNVPPFATFVDNGDNSGTFTFSPAVGERGSYPNITVTADDGNGGTDNEAFTLGVSDGVSASTVLYRVNAAGPAVTATAGGPDWAVDTKFNPSPLHNTGSKTTTFAPGVVADATVPASTPIEVFETERKDPLVLPEMEWEFPAAAGETVEVRLYFANNSAGTSTVGARKFDVMIDGNLVLDDYDIVADVGHQVATMKSFQVVSDGIVDVDFGNVKNRPIVNAVEVLGSDARPILSPGGYGGAEGDAGSTVFEIPITLSEPSTETITVDYINWPCETFNGCGDGLATDGVDYDGPVPDTLVFLPGETVQTVPVTVYGDTDVEPKFLWGEWFLIRFLNPSSNAVLDTSFFGLGAGVIGNDDP